MQSVAVVRVGIVSVLVSNQLIQFQLPNIPTPAPAPAPTTVTIITINPNTAILNTFIPILRKR